MKKLISLIKACMTENMSLFKIKSKNTKKGSKAILPVILALVFFFTIWSYANMFMEPLVELHLEYILLSLFVFITFILTLIEGIYKSSNLLFNCKDDDLLLSLPIKKSTVLFIRIFKFYVFELLYNSLFLLPAIVVYIRYVNVDWTFYLVSVLMLLLLPIIPIVISCVIGLIISEISSRFKFKNIAQIFITTLFLLAVFYVSSNMQNMITNFGQKAQSINEVISKIYYPAGLYAKLAINFKAKDLILFVLFNIALFALAILIFGNIYFKINSRVKTVKKGATNSKYKISTKKPMKALIKKELNRFINSPVFVTNAGFGLVLFVIGCIALVVKFDKFAEVFAGKGLNITMEQINSYIPLLAFAFVCFASFMSSITSSMISLEGKSINILKSLPVKPATVITAKVLTAVIVMIPFILIGDLILFIRFPFNIFEIIMILVASIILPLVAETIGILVNLKYPKMDAENDTQVVKQSMSSTMAVLLGMIIMAATYFVGFKMIDYDISTDLIMFVGLATYILIYIGLLAYLHKEGTKRFNEINV